MSDAIVINTELVKIETSILKQNNEQLFSLFISPTQQFSHQSITHDIINVFIALDISGSMNCDVPNIDNTISNNSRYSCCIKSLQQLLQLFRKLVSIGKQIYIWVYAFNSITQPIIENYIIYDNDKCINDIITKCDNISPRFGTDISSVVRRIERETSYLRVSDNIRNISLLLSDGFTNEGMTSDQLINKYSNFFDATIGIGEDDDYDMKLLKALSKEGMVRGCMTSDDIYDQLIDAIFNDLEVYANSMIINIPNDIKVIQSNSKYELDTHNKIYFNKLRFSQPIMITFEGCPHSFNLQFNDIKLPILEEQDYTLKYENMDYMEVSLAKINNNIYDIDVSFTDEATNHYDNNETVNIGYYTTISNYLHILKDFNSFDMNNIAEIEVLKSKINDTLLYIANINTHMTHLMRIILSQFKVRLETLHQNMLIDELDMNVDELPELIPNYRNKKMRMTSDNNTPLSPSQSVTSVRIMRSQAGNYASLSRELSEYYSQSPKK
jgi:hypothetical protein